MFVVGCNFTRPGWLDRVWAHLTPEIAWRINLGLVGKNGEFVGRLVVCLEVHGN